VPATNLYFIHSRKEEDITERQEALADLCWPFHALVIERLTPRAILCLGSTAGKYVCKKLGANRLIGQFIEQNNCGWTSETFENPQGTRVVIATHPSRVDWCAPATDPSHLVRKALQDAQPYWRRPRGRARGAEGHACV